MLLVHGPESSGGTHIACLASLCATDQNHDGVTIEAEIDLVPLAEMKPVLKGSPTRRLLVPEIALTHPPQGDHDSVGHVGRQRIEPISERGSAVVRPKLPNLRHPL